MTRKDLIRYLEQYVYPEGSGTGYLIIQNKNKYEAYTQKEVQQAFEKFIAMSVTD